MAKFVVLVNWTEKGVGSAKQTTERAAQVGDMIKGLGGTMDLILWTLGRYDLVAVCDAPDDETAALIGLKLGAQGMIRTETLRAFTSDEIGSIIGRL
ncbi:MAG: GYD domain-containing protein [Chloroflexota bacterium]|jgi:uncharacterized protein with GYD domain|nr:GYD domain-containing protein [Chloroflexota bacterium]